jgi:ubiquinone/menaquinone biosynthesis C-methylase UbiE
VTDLPFTGERFIPGTQGEIWVEHWHRYHFAARWCEGKRVLDVACGEGYGSALLARGAAHVTGVDISPEAVAHAKKAYALLANAQFVCAPCTALPLADASVDVAVTFETIEHISGQAEFLNEIARVLKPDGVLVLSCPNKLEYSDKRNFANEFHVKELYRDELAALVGARFPHLAWYGQRPSFFSVIAPEGKRESVGQLIETAETSITESVATLSHPLYFLLVAARSSRAVEALRPAMSVFADRDDWVHRDYEKVMRDLNLHAERGRMLQAQMLQRDRSIAELQEAVRLAEEALRRGEEALGETQAQLAKRDNALHVREAELTIRNLTISEKDHELAARRSWRWWLKLPLIRLGILK